MDPKIERRKALQRRSRRMKNLLLKAVDLSTLCDAEVFLGVRIRETGRVTTFCSDPEGLWSSATLNLVCFSRLLNLIFELTMNRKTITPSPSIRRYKIFTMERIRTKIRSQMWKMRKLVEKSEWISFCWPYSDAISNMVITQEGNSARQMGLYIYRGSRYQSIQWKWKSLR